MIDWIAIIGALRPEKEIGMYSAYMRYLALTEAISGEIGSSLDLASRKLLEVVAVAADKGEPLTVTRVMFQNQIASPATIHRKLNQLIELGYVDQQFKGSNRRTKYLSPTLKAIKLFATLGQAMLVSK